MTNDDVVHELELAKSILQDRCDDVDGVELQRLTAAIAVLRQEIGAIEAKNLGSADYSPVVDEFKAATDAGKKFEAQLDQIKSDFETINAVAGALDDVLGIIAQFAK